MFNWHSLPTFGTMLLYCMLAVYMVTRGPRSLVSLTAIAAQVSAAAYLLGQGMQANAMVLGDWMPWARNLQWGATVAPVAWYWLTVLLLREQSQGRWIGFPLGVILTVVSVVLTVSMYAGDWLYNWSAVTNVEPQQAFPLRYHVPVQPFYLTMVAFLAGSTLGAAANVWIGWHLPMDAERRRRFGWLFLSAMLFVVGTSYLSFSTLLAWDQFPTWLGHVLLGAAMAVMAWNVAAYSLLIQGLVIRTDFFYFFTALTLVCLMYGLLFLLAGLHYSYELLGLLVMTLIVVVVTHALFDVGRRVLDRLFFGSEVQRLRSNLTSVVQTAALTPNLDALLGEARDEIDEVSMDRLVRLTEEALRRLNSPDALARCSLATRLPRTLEHIRLRRGDPERTHATPLDQSQGLREALATAIDRLKLPDREQTRGAPAALQYNILREEYVLDLPNKQIMSRYGISEATFHRNRRGAIRILAQELGKRENMMSLGRSDSI